MSIHYACKLKVKTGREPDAPLFRLDMEVLGIAIAEAGIPSVHSRRSEEGRVKCVSGCMAQFGRYLGCSFVQNAV
jgi:hypothetical protein